LDIIILYSCINSLRNNCIFLQFYQDTLEIDEDKDQRERESEEESKKDKDLILDEEKDNRDDDDIGSNSMYFIIILTH